MGMVMTPVVDTLATAAPLTMPSRPELTTAALAGPPVPLPTLRPMSMSSCPLPQAEKRAPKMMK